MRFGNRSLIGSDGLARLRRTRRSLVMLVLTVLGAAAAGGRPARAAGFSDDDRRYLQSKNERRGDDRPDDDGRGDEGRGDEGRGDDRRTTSRSPGSRENDDGCEPRCFRRGTRIATTAGAVAVEDLAVGDRVRIVSQEYHPIVAIEHRRFEKRGAEWPRDLQPVLLRRASLGDDSPRRDLWVTAGHAVQLGGVFVLARDLVNGRSILCDPVAEADVLDYFHIALAHHDAVDADGVFCETLCDPGMVARARLVGPGGLRGEVGSRLRSALSLFVDRRRPFDRVRDDIEERARL